jgi:hypothetical protein
MARRLSKRGPAPPGPPPAPSPPRCPGRPPPSLTATPPSRKPTRPPGREHRQHHRLVHHRAAAVHDCAVVNPVALRLPPEPELPARPEDARGDGDGVAAADPDDRDRPLRRHAWGRGPVAYYSEQGDVVSARGCRKMGYSNRGPRPSWAGGGGQPLRRLPVTTDAMVSSPAVVSPQSPLPSGRPLVDAAALPPPLSNPLPPLCAGDAAAAPTAGARAAAPGTVRAAGARRARHRGACESACNSRDTSSKFSL